MNNKEAIINKVYETKSGEFCVQLKFKFDELTIEQKEALRLAWREGEPQNVSIVPFQPLFDPDQTTL